MKHSIPSIARRVLAAALAVAALQACGRALPWQGTPYAEHEELIKLTEQIARAASGSAAAEAFVPDETGIRVNQVGYRPGAVKRAVFAGIVDASDEFYVLDAATGERVYEGTLSGAIDNPWAGEVNRVADFTALDAPGTYRIQGADGALSPAFAIGEGVYDALLGQVERMLYLQRCGVELPEAEAGAYAHPACHNTLAKVYGTDERIDVSGGWHDAGDYGRYVVPGAKAAVDLMLAVEHRRAVLGRRGLPGADEVLREAKHELDWMLKMQAASGGVYHKVTCNGFPGFVMPQFETNPLVVCPVSNAATGDFAAAMAMAARLYAADWPGDARRYLAAAERAWDYLVAHEGDPGFKNPLSVTTGEYGDDDDSDEYFWAAAELARTTGKAEYRRAAGRWMSTGGKRRGLGWTDVGTYGVLAVLNDPGLSADDPLVAAARSELKAAVDEAAARIAANPYGADRTDAYEWGSNMGVANAGALFTLAADLLGDADLLALAQQPLDYLLGRNATGYCFVTGAGTVSPQNPHHRPSVAVGRAMPGMLVGGPDSGLDDGAARRALKGAAPAKCYVDDTQSYSTNEICIYWNSPLLLLLAGVMDGGAAEIGR